MPSDVLALCGNVSSQGDPLNDPISGDGWYYAFLSKLDPHYPDNDKGKGDPDGLTATFEIAPRDYVENAILRTDSAVRTFPRNMPASLLHFESVLETDLRSMLKLAESDLLAEGEWYLVKVENPPAKGINGVMVDPEA